MIGLVAAVWLAYGCYIERNVSVTPDVLIGDYVHRSSDRGLKCDPDRLTLRPDGTYVLVRMPGGHRGETMEGAWKLIQRSNPTVLLDHAGYDVKIRDEIIRLIISYDRDEWYERTMDRSN